MGGVFDCFDGQSFAAVDVVFVIVEFAVFDSKASCSFREGILMASA